MKKIIFLDVDGTLIGPGHIMPESAKEAIKKVRANGHYVALCTGRTYSTIPDWLMNIGFDGVIASTGANVYWNGEEIYNNYIPKDELHNISKVLNKHNASAVFEGRDGRFVTETHRNSIDTFFGNTGSGSDANIFEFDVVDVPYNMDAIEGGVYINCDVDIEQIQKEVGDKIKITGASFSKERTYNGEFTLNGVNKATGMKIIIEHIDELTRDDIIAFGDGLNDLEMIEYAKIGVAMGNAVDELKAIADMVTTNVLDDGIYNGFKKLNLID